MASPSLYEVEVTVISALDLKNVNWRYGDLKPYAVVWVDPATKCSAKVDVEGDVNPVWEDEKLRIPLPYDRRIEDSTLRFDVVHARSDDQENDTKPLIGSARLPLREVVDEAGIGGPKVTRNLKLERPSSRPQGMIEVRVAVKEPSRYYDPYATHYGQSIGTGSSTSYRDYPAPPHYGQPQYGGGYAQPYSAAPTEGYPYSAPPPQAYGDPPAAAVQEQKKSKFGMGTGLAVGAVAGVLGGVALSEGIDYAEDKIEDDVAERVEDDDGLAVAYEDGGYDDDF